MSHLCRLTFPSLILGCAVVSLGAGCQASDVSTADRGPDLTSQNGQIVGGEDNTIEPGGDKTTPIGPGDVRSESFAFNVCDASNGVYDPLRGVEWELLANNEDPVAFHELREEDDGVVGGAPRVISTTGTACAMSTPAASAACLAKLAAFRSTTGWSHVVTGGAGIRHSHRYVVHDLNGPLVVSDAMPQDRFMSTPRGFGAVKSEAGAAFAATQLLDHEIDCSAPNVRPILNDPRYVVFEVRTKSGSICDAGEFRNVVQVQQDGNSTVVRSTLVRPPQHCP